MSSKNSIWNFEFSKPGIAHADGPPCLDLLNNGSTAAEQRITLALLLLPRG